MATDLRTLPAYFNTDANFRDWGSGIAAQLAACGLVQTADTGQVNWTTVSKPGAANTMQGYEIWRFNDAAQATTPVYIKVQYGSGGSSAARPALTIQTGSGSNGSGTLTGQLTTSTAVPANGTKTAGDTLPSYCSGGSGWIALCNNLDAASANYSLGFVIERPFSSAGTAQTDGHLVQLFSGSSTTYHQVAPNSGSVGTQGSTYGIHSLATYQVTSAGATVGVWPGVWIVNGRAYGTRLLAYKHSDVGELVAVSPISYHGSNRTYMPLGDGGFKSPNDSTMAFMIPWE